jgi:hypothetical protein
METGTGVFLAGLVIGLVMLYGQTKDRWDWKKITKYAGITIGIIIFIPVTYFYHESNNWKAFQVDLSIKGFVVAITTIIVFLVIAASPAIVLGNIYEKVYDKNFEWDEEGNERPLYKITNIIFFVIFFVLLIFYYEYFKEVISSWLAPVFK